jgi:hypothetical protein
MALACCAAEAQAAKAPSPEGQWTFVTGPQPDGCIFTGRMAMKKAGAGKFSCTFSAEWTCKVDLPHRTQTEQSCTATQTGADIAITSKLEKVVATDPAGMLAEMRTRYLADQFVVTINAEADEMDGRSFDKVNHAKVKFRRKQDLVS